MLLFYTVWILFALLAFAFLLMEDTLMAFREAMLCLLGLALWPFAIGVSVIGIVICLVYYTGEHLWNRRRGRAANAERVRLGYSEK